MRRQRKLRRHRRGGVFMIGGVDIEITYRGIDMVKDGQIRKVLGSYSTGSGAGFFDRNKPPLRDHAATVPPEKLAVIVRKLKKIPKLTIKRRVTKWVLCR